MDWATSIKQLRKSRGLKQQALAEILSCDQTAISHWERSVDLPSLGYQRKLLRMIADEERASDDLRLYTAVEKSPHTQFLVDQEARVLAASEPFWNMCASIEGIESYYADVFRDFGAEENKRLIKQIFERIGEILLVEGDVTFRPKGITSPVRMHGIGAPIRLSDGVEVLRIGLAATDSAPDVSPSVRFI